MRNSRLLAVALAAMSLSLAGVAGAQTKPEGYTYDFLEEDLLGETLGSPPPILTGGHRMKRIMLLRPRAAFVVEMLKSVETM